jgi:hypothetical protein
MKNTLNWLRRNGDKGYHSGVDFFYGEYLGHRIRLTGDGKLQVGCADFDRWANSVAVTIKIDEGKSIPLQVNLAIVEAGKDTRGYFERSCDVMLALMD